MADMLAVVTGASAGIGLSLGAAFGKGITMKMGQTNIYVPCSSVEKCQIDPSSTISLHHAGSGSGDVQNLAR
jgi:hypothetical protein